MAVVLAAEPLREAYDRLLAAFGAQQWWPARSPFEVMVGAVLVQNTAWSNVERAIARLEEAGRLTAATLAECDPQGLSDLIRPAGYHNLKARRLHNLCSAYLAAGEHAGLSALPTPALRRWLLAINGIGPESADAILLYAFDRPVFVVDAYLRRVFSRLGWIEGGEGYEVLRQAVETALPPEPDVYNEYHALLVALGKDYCRPSPRCEGCPLGEGCRKG